MKILLAIDGSEDALRAVETAAKMFGAQPDAQFLLVFVDEARQYERAMAVAIGAGPGAFHTPEWVEEISEMARTQPLRLTQSSLDRLAAANLSGQVFLESGQPAKQILAVAHREQADVIVMGRRGIHGISRLIMGSVSSAVLDGAKIPVLVVP